MSLVYPSSRVYLWSQMWIQSSQRDWCRWNLDQMMRTVRGRGDSYLHRWHWHLLQDHSYASASQHEDTVPKNSLSQYSPSHPAETRLGPHQTVPGLGLQGHAHSSAVGTPRRLHAGPIGHRKPCPNGHGRKLLLARSIFLTHSWAATVASLEGTKGWLEASYSTWIDLPNYTPNTYTTTRRSRQHRGSYHQQDGPEPSCHQGQNLAAKVNSAPSQLSWDSQEELWEVVSGTFNPSGRSWWW